FLKKIYRVGFGELLFNDVRYNADGSPKPDFVLNDPKYAGGTVLVSGPQFGIGSSREHAPWAIQQYGFHVVIAPSFGDIFRNNCFQNGLLPVQLTERDVQTLIQRAQELNNYEITVDLEAQEVHDSMDFTAKFEVDPFRKNNLLKGLDDIGLTLEHASDIDEYEKAHA
ncbi:MAG: 3-isopropylmalate dehydratase small subunit, partial [Chloroflexi bacterium]|nr:3-isopropylmalate dehydratase small subunit [Chloroflexota bacterium]